MTFFSAFTLQHNQATLTLRQPTTALNLKKV